jgi:hypothetical protein
MKFEIAFSADDELVELNYHDAKLYCFALNRNGKTGWRLPTLTELDALHKSYPEDLFGYCYWSSEEPINNRGVMVMFSPDDPSVEDFYSDDEDFEYDFEDDFEDDHFDADVNQLFHVLPVRDIL